MAASTDNPITTVTTTLTVKIIDSGSAAAGTLLLRQPSQRSRPEFTGTESATLAPSWSIQRRRAASAHMQQMEVHFQPGSKTGELYEISLLSAYSEYRYYTRCYADPAKFLLGACALEIDATR